MKNFILKILAITFFITLCVGVLNACGDESHTHSYIALKSNDSSHWYECLCGDKQPLEKHKGGVATTTSKKVCEVCGVEYGEKLNENHTHEYNTLKSNENTHWYECSCGEKQGVEEHKGGTATETQKAKCEVCNEEYGAFLIPEHVHNFNVLKYDNEKHWFECPCGDSQTPENHKGGVATELKKAECEVCHQEYGNLVEHIHYFTQKNPIINYLKTNATCKSKAVYFYSCNCGVSGEETFEYGSILEHDYVNGVCSKCKDIFYQRNGSYLYFGKYPQTLKSNSVTVNSAPNSNGYYNGSDGEEYAKVVADTYSSGYKFSTGASIEKGKEYYFKVEPIKWKIISETGNELFLLCDMIIENKRYDDTYNNYKDSEVRSWLNNEFYNKAFNSLQQELILITTVDNSVASTGYDSNEFVCDNTQDKIFLISYADVTSSKLGLNSNNYRKKLSSDYARANKIYVDADPRNYGCSAWWLRSPVNDNDSYVFEVWSNGNVDYAGDWVQRFYVGIVPALKIKLK